MGRDDVIPVSLCGQRCYTCVSVWAEMILYLCLCVGRDDVIPVSLCGQRRCYTCVSVGQR